MQETRRFEGGMSIRYSSAPRGFGKQMKAAIEEAGTEIGVGWVKKSLPKHFTHEGAREYGYARRTFKHEIKKARRFHHRLPLVFTGTLKREVMTAVRVDASARQIKIKMKGPNWLKGYMAFAGKTGSGPDKVKELTTISEGEARGFVKVMEERTSGFFEKK